MTSIFGVASDPYYTPTTGYQGRHRDEHPQSLADGIARDYRAMRSAAFPETHYRAKHSAYIPRAAA